MHLGMCSTLVVLFDLWQIVLLHGLPTRGIARFVACAWASVPADYLIDILSTLCLACYRVCLLLCVVHFQNMHDCVFSGAGNRRSCCACSWNSL